MDTIKRWRFGDGTIRLTQEEAKWLINQPGTPGFVWVTDEEWAGPGFTRRNDESTS